MIQVRDLTFSHSGEPALFGKLSWSVDRGCPWAVVGASGSGKTTLLHLLAGLLIPGSGTVRIDGDILDRPRPATGLILQRLGLMPWATVDNNVRLGFQIRRFYGPDGKHAPRDWSTDREEMDRRVDAWLQRLGLWELRHKLPGDLSGGERQRVAIARTMVLDPDLLLMDEPFSSLDPDTRASLQELMLKLEREAGHTRILVTHDVAEAATLGRKILVLGRGGISRGIVDNQSYKDQSAQPTDTSIVERVRGLMR